MMKQTIFRVKRANVSRKQNGLTAYLFFPAVFDLQLLGHAGRKQKEPIYWRPVYLSHDKGS